MYLAGRWADRQLSRLELAAAVIILSLLLFVMMQHMLKLFAQAERSLLTRSVININTALQYRAAGYILRNDYPSLAAMEGINPFTMAATEPGWLNPATAPATIPGLMAGVTKAPPMVPELMAGFTKVEVPVNYLGELDGPDPAAIEGGHWYYDRRDKVLVYHIDNAEYFSGGSSSPARVVFTVDIDYEDRNDNNQFDPEIDAYRSIQLQAIDGYTWHITD
jgi:hypothetical protein